VRWLRGLIMHQYSKLLRLVAMLQQLSSTMIIYNIYFYTLAVYVVVKINFSV